MCIVTITLSVQNQDNEQSCALLPLHYLYKVFTWLCTGSQMETIHMTAHFLGLVQVV
jgi:hypothetical protein